MCVCVLCHSYFVHCFQYHKSIDISLATKNLEKAKNHCNNRTNDMFHYLPNRASNMISLFFLSLSLTLSTFVRIAPENNTQKYAFVDFDSEYLSGSNSFCFRFNRCCLLLSQPIMFYNGIFIMLQWHCNRCAGKESKRQFFVSGVLFALQQQENIIRGIS